MDDAVGTAVTNVPVINLQPLIDRITSVADIGTLVLLLIVFILIGLLISERARNSTLTKNYMKQSIEIVKVLTSVEKLMDGHQDSLQGVEAALQRLASSVLEIQLVLRIRRMPKTAVIEHSPEEAPAEKGTDT